MSADFSRLARQYARGRPRYPDELFAWLAEQAPSRDFAWDCACGNGQATLGLAAHFDRVTGTDVSDEQIAHAFPNERVTYRVAAAERSGIDDGSIDAITVAQAVHWFDLDAFYAEARRVLKPRGVLAVWTYHLPVVTQAVDDVLARLYYDVLGGYWAPQMRHLDERYANLPFVEGEIAAPEFVATAAWTLDDLLGFLRSWSGGANYRERNGSDPIEVVREELERAWGDRDGVREVGWPLAMRVARVE
jgi:ubiquinone/menaquinone biosynthesis C-methylase UbiE